MEEALFRTSQLVVMPVGTPVFLAPEVVRTGRHSISSDKWSLACTVTNLVTCKLPWSAEDNIFAALYKTGLRQSPPYDPLSVDDALHAFLTLCFEPDASLRPCPADLLALPLLVSADAEQQVACI